MQDLGFHSYEDLNHGLLGCDII